MRKLRKVLMALPLLCLSVSFTLAQTTENSNNQGLKDFYQKRTAFDDVKSGNNYYVLIKFDDLPDKSEILQLEKAKIQLLEYRSKNTYLAVVPNKIDQSTLKRLNITTVQKPAIEHKLCEAILNKEYPDWAVQEAGSVDIAIVFFEKTPQSKIQSILNNFNINILENKHRGNTTIVGRIDQNKVEELAKSPLVAFVDVIQEPVDILNHENRLVQRTNVLNSSAPGGYGLLGNGVVVGVGDGGQLGEHIDFGSRVFNEANGTYSSFGDHGDHVAGIIGGAGSLNPRHRGMAPECQIVTQKTSLITYKTEEYINNYGMVLTNNSYGTSFNCLTNGSYNYSAQTLDWQLREFPEMLHVYAAGNSGGGTCDPYPQGYKTVLRYYQSAKNVLTVGNVGEDRVISSSSSRGPVKDGRIKPEICGIGKNVTSTGREFNYKVKGGTSMASPSVVGVLALLVEKYRLLNSGQNPEGGLLKAIACNTADDLGNPGPDYVYGFGLINARRAIESLEDANYFIDNINQGENQAHNITVPSDTRQLKLMLYWHDKEAAIYPEKALVNDLDIELITPNGSTILPWVLNIDPTHVGDIASRDIDTLNNIEQITIDLPMAGDYTIIINGTNVPFGNQRYFVTYETIANEIVVTHPFGGENLIPGNTEFVEWDADPKNTNSFKVEYSLDGGNSWLLIAPAVEADQRFVNWTLPEVSIDNAVVRVSKNGDTVYGESNMFFSILSPPENFSAATVCEGMIELNWDVVDYAVEYQVLMSVGNEMTVIGTTTENSYVVDNALEFGEQYWFSVRAMNQNNQFSERVAAQPGIPEDIVTCPWEDDPIAEGIITSMVGREKTQKGLTDTEEIAMKVRNMGTNSISGFDLFYSINGGDPVQETYIGTIEPGDSVIYDFLQKADLSEGGIYNIDSWVFLDNDTHNFNDSIVGQHAVIQIENKPVSLPFLESFSGIENIVYLENKLGLTGAQRWDFETQGFGKLSAISSTGTLKISPTVFSQAADLDNFSILTLNMTGYSVEDKNVGLSFKYKTTPLHGTIEAVELSNKIQIRGSDNDEWLEFYTLNDNEPEWKSVNGLQISELLQLNGQGFSSSFQLRFSQNNVSELEIDEISLFDLDVDIPDEVLLIVNFTGEQVGDDIILKWNTTIEPIDEFFEIQVADNYKNGTDDEFEVIGTVHEFGTTTQPYIFNDTRPGKKGKKYYRLKQINADGNFAFSPVLMVDYDVQKSEVFPNPFSNELTVQIESDDEIIVNLILSDNNGRIIDQLTSIVEAGTQYITFTTDSDLPSGMYFLRIVSQGKATFHKLFKQTKR
jgi:subtilisin family serine protease